MAGGEDRYEEFMQEYSMSRLLRKDVPPRWMPTATVVFHFKNVSDKGDGYYLTITIGYLASLIEWQNLGSFTNGQRSGFQVCIFRNSFGVFSL